MPLNPVREYSPLEWDFCSSVFAYLHSSSFILRVSKRQVYFVICTIGPIHLENGDLICNWQVQVLHRLPPPTAPPLVALSQGRELSCRCSMLLYILVLHSTWIDNQYEESFSHAVEWCPILFYGGEFLPCHGESQLTLWIVPCKTSDNLYLGLQFNTKLDREIASQCWLQKDTLQSERSAWDKNCELLGLAC